MSTSLGFVYLNLVCNEMEQKGNFCDHDFSTVVKIILALYTYLLCSANDPLKVTPQLMGKSFGLFAAWSLCLFLVDIGESMHFHDV